ncbi:hypothetical protein K443DRAFT_680523 [Laccaria amethystina LaAM-08-1]|uniref:Uncharacterized protein n=1 Tax=Laccaria amethystina LaAM-08-1 TaxID=1095629 RepID=A0A0C9XB91_9AGAR|nr:hypothetical protein K443DRAFT_680523 [Laccaria amethystina LaAM-08-1]
MEARLQANFASTVLQGDKETTFMHNTFGKRNRTCAGQALPSSFHTMRTSCGMTERRRRARQGRAAALDDYTA